MIMLPAMQYYQIITAIPASLKSSAFTHLDLGKLNSISENVDVQISKDVSSNLKKTSCKQFYKLFTENISIEPTAVTTWRKHCTVVADKWEQSIENNHGGAKPPL